MDAFVTVRYKLSNLCNEEDLVDIKFEEMVKDLIEKEGIWSMADDDSEEILNIELA
jgi:hypothetical protein